MSMCRHISRLLRISPLVLLGGLPSSAALARNTTVFPAKAPMGITVGPDGAIWYADSATKSIGRIDLSGAAIAFATPGRSPNAITAGPDGNLWFTAYEGRIGRMTASGVITEFALPDPGSGPSSIASGPDGNLWFTETEANKIGRITTSGVVTEFSLPTSADPGPGLSGRLGNITAGPDGNVWFTETGANKIGRITTSGTVTEFDLPKAESFPFRIVAGPDGNLWFTEYYYSPTYIERVGRITPTGSITEFHVPGGAYEIALGAGGELWLGAYGALKRMTTNGNVTVFPVSDSPDAFPVGLAASADGAIWMAAARDWFDGIDGYLVRFLADTSACITDGATLCLDGGRFRATTQWGATDGSIGHGHAVNLTANSGYFWFFDAANIEMVVKVLDGCSSNGHHWAFAAGLTNVFVTTTVTDTYSGVTRTYTNQQGTPFAPIQDTAAFATCP